MQGLHHRVDQPALRGVQLRLHQLLRQAGHEHSPQQAPGGGDAGGHSTLPGRAIEGRGFAIRQPDEDETGLSPDEVRVAIRNGWTA